MPRLAQAQCLRISGHFSANCPAVPEIRRRLRKTKGKKEKGKR
jgi:hypothetical protein